MRALSRAHLFHPPDQVLGHPYRGSVYETAVQRDGTLALLGRSLHRLEDPMGAFYLFVGGREDLVRQPYLRRMDRPLPLAPQRRRALRGGPVTVGVVEITERAVDRAEAFGSACRDHPADREVPLLSPVEGAVVQLIGVREDAITRVRSADV